MRNRQDKLENTNANTRKTLIQLEKRVKANTRDRTGNGDPDLMGEAFLMKDLKLLREEFMQYKQMVVQSFEEVKVEILLRAYKEDLVIQETRIVDKLKDMIMQIL